MSKYKASSITDTSDLEVLKWVETASAVNELTITSAAAGNPPSLTATGDDSNIDLLLSGKGTGGINLDSGTLTATASGGAATLSKTHGVVTSEALTTAAGADYTLTLTNTKIAATSFVLVSLDNGTNTTNPIYVRLVTPGSGSVVIVVRNDHGASALNGTIKISFVVFN